jgi:hypothetical protein
MAAMASLLTEAAVNGGRSDGGLRQWWSLSKEAAVGWMDDDAIGVVHSNVGQNVTPHNPSLGLFVYHFLHRMSL